MNSDLPPTLKPVEPSPYMGEVISIAFAQWYPGDEYTPEHIKVVYRDPETGSQTTIRWTKNDAEMIFTELARVKAIYDRANEAKRRIEARNKASFASRTRGKSAPPKLDLKDLLT